MKVAERDLRSHIKLNKALLGSLAKADTDLKATMKKRDAKAQAQKDKSNSAVSKAEKKSAADESKRLRQMQTAVDKTGVHPALAFNKSDSLLQQMLTFQDLAAMKSAHLDLEKLHSGLPTIILDALPQFQNNLNDASLKKMLAVFKAQFKQSPQCQKSGRTQCPIKLPIHKVVREQMLQCMPATVNFTENLDSSLTGSNVSAANKNDVVAALTGVSIFGYNEAHSK